MSTPGNPSIINFSSFSTFQPAFEALIYSHISNNLQRFLFPISWIYYSKSNKYHKKVDKLFLQFSSVHLRNKLKTKRVQNPSGNHVILLRDIEVHLNKTKLFFGVLLPLKR